MRASASSSSSSKHRMSGIVIVDRQCYCGEAPLLWTSWTEANPGRKYYGCRHNRESSQACNYFDWVDPPIDHPIARLNDELIELKIEMERRETENLIEKKALLEELQKKHVADMMGVKGRMKESFSRLLWFVTGVAFGIMFNVFFGSG